MRIIILKGNIVNGYEAIGPFYSIKAAKDFAVHNEIEQFDIMDISNPDE